jgi:hypothetical protein
MKESFIFSDLIITATTETNQIGRNMIATVWPSFEISKGWDSEKFHQKTTEIPSTTETRSEISHLDPGS